MPRRVLILCALLPLVGCETPGHRGGLGGWFGKSQTPPLLDGMGKHHRAVTTPNELAQRYFDQGLTLAYSFNHDEAIRSFGEAGRLDPECAMAFWGVALCNGPHINNPIVPDERSAAAWDALQKALAHKDKCTDVEQALIEALAKRYANPAPEDRSGLDKAYADAMVDVQCRFPDDPDVGTLTAEALMDLQPWDLWDKQGQPKGETTRILALLERVLEMNPENPGANHLYVHAVEASPQPERANAAADRLRTLVPGSGHMVHMPSHIDVLCGRWEQACRQNELAIAADKKYRKVVPRQGFYRLYMIHNHHMLSFAGMMSGQSKLALKAGREVVESIPEDYKRQEAALVDPFMMVVPEVQMRFGMWDEILKEPAPPDYLPISNALWHYARGVALAAKGRLQQAEAERAAFQKAVENVPQDALMSINPAHDVLAIAGKVLDGEIAYRRGEIDEAVSLFKAAIALEDKLLYMEPPEWIQPVRHVLGAVLLEAGRFDEAERVYREDLKKWPENGWSLYGISRCLASKGDASEATEYEERFRKAWAKADVKIHASCLCIGPTAAK